MEEDCSFEDAILGGQFDDDIKKRQVSLPQIILIKQILGIMIQQKVFLIQHLVVQVTLENRGEKSDPDPGDDKSIILLRFIVKQVWMIGQKL